MLLDSGAYIIINDNHGNKNLYCKTPVISTYIIYGTPIWVPYGTHMGPIWEQLKNIKVGIFPGLYEKILDQNFLQMRFRFTYTYLAKI